MKTHEAIQLTPNMDLQQTLSENKKRTFEMNKRRREMLLKLQREREREQNLQKNLIITVICLLSIIMYMFLNHLTNKDMNECIAQRGVDYCVRELG